MTPDFPSLVATHLFYGRDRAVTLSQIAEDMGVSRRVVEKAIEQMRLQGVPICTGSDGAWLTTNYNELMEHAGALTVRAWHIRQGANALRRTARRFEKYQQQTLPWAS